MSGNLPSNRFPLGGFGAKRSRLTKDYTAPLRTEIISLSARRKAKVCFDDDADKEYSFINPDVSQVILKALADGFYYQNAPSSKETRHVRYFITMYFVRWLRETGAGITDDDLMYNYLGWLETRTSKSGAPLTRKRVHSMYQQIIGILRIAQRIAGNEILANVSLPNAPFRRPKLPHSSSESLTREQLRKVKAAVEQEIRAVERRVTTKSFMPNAKDLYPFFLLLMMKTWANSDALLNYNVSSLRPHPVFASDAVLSWTKGRSNHEQFQRHDDSRAYEAPDVFRRIERLTQVCRRRANVADKRFLFLVAKPDCQVARMTRVMLERPHAACVAKYNLDHFNFRMLRATLGRIDYGTHGDIRRTQKKFGHVDPRDTKYYVEDPLNRQLNNEVIYRAQLALHAKWLRPGSTDDDVASELDVTKKAAADI